MLERIFTWRNLERISLMTGAISLNNGLQAIGVLWWAPSHPWGWTDAVLLAIYVAIAGVACLKAEHEEHQRLIEAAQWGAEG